jgi:hypothetical protein
LAAKGSVGIGEVANHIAYQKNGRKGKCREVRQSVGRNILGLNHPKRNEQQYRSGSVKHRVKKGQASHVGTTPLNFQILGEQKE